jgi:hypothetical protein
VAKYDRLSYGKFPNEKRRKDIKNDPIKTRQKTKDLMFV